MIVIDSSALYFMSLCTISGLCLLCVFLVLGGQGEGDHSPRSHMATVIVYFCPFALSFFVRSSVSSNRTVP